MPPHSSRHPVRGGVPRRFACAARLLHLALVLLYVVPAVVSAQSTTDEERYRKLKLVASSGHGTGVWTQESCGVVTRREFWSGSWKDHLEDSNEDLFPDLDLIFDAEENHWIEGKKRRRDVYVDTNGGGTNVVTLDQSVSSDGTARSVLVTDYRSSWWVASTVRIYEIDLSDGSFSDDESYWDYSYPPPPLTCGSSETSVQRSQGTFKREFGPILKLESLVLGPEAIIDANQFQGGDVFDATVTMSEAPTGGDALVSLTAEPEWPWVPRPGFTQLTGPTAASALQFKIPVSPTGRTGTGSVWTSPVLFPTIETIEATHEKSRPKQATLILRPIDPTSQVDRVLDIMDLLLRGNTRQAGADSAYDAALSLRHYMAGGTKPARDDIYLVAAEHYFTWYRFVRDNYPLFTGIAFVPAVGLYELLKLLPAGGGLSIMDLFYLALGDDLPSAPTGISLLFSLNGLGDALLDYLGIHLSAARDLSVHRSNAAAVGEGGALPPGAYGISVGRDHACVLPIAGSPACWGMNSSGQLGDGSTTQRSMPTSVARIGALATAVAAGGSHTCAVTRGEGVSCWGSNAHGQLGNGSTTDSAQPVAVTALEPGVRAIVAGSDHTCALMASGSVWCWGRNDAGQLGNDSTVASTTPVSVSELGAVARITAGAKHTCAVTTGGAVWCWGDNAFGQLGSGAVARSLVPVPVSGLPKGMATVAAGDGHTCAVTAAGSLWCWGDNTSGQLGIGTTTSSLLPVAVPTLQAGVAALAAGAQHTCAVTSSGIVSCWGLNAMGQLGDGSGTNRLSPTPVPSAGDDLLVVSAGASHTCALARDGRVLCWGSNTAGQLGDETTSNRPRPDTVSGFVGLTPGSITGHVLGTGSVPLVGVNIRLFNALGMNVVNGTTGVDGAFSIDGLLPGAYLARTSNTQGYVDQLYAGLLSSQQDVAVGTEVTVYPKAATDLEFRLVPGTAISGRLTDAGTGSAITNNAWVDVYAADGRPAGRSEWPDSSGTYITPALPPGTYFLRTGNRLNYTDRLYNSMSASLPVNQGTPIVMASPGRVTDVDFALEIAAVLPTGAPAVTSQPLDQTVALGALASFLASASGAPVPAVQWQQSTDGGGTWSDIAGATATTFTVRPSGGGRFVQYRAVFVNAAGRATTDAATLRVTASTRDPRLGLAAGLGHTCARTSTDGVECWGSNTNGQLGNGTTNESFTPTAVVGLSTSVLAVAAGDDHSCALANVGTVLCWGRNDSGQLGNSTTTDRWTPTRAAVPGGSVVGITAGANHTCAILADGAVLCWGRNEYGQLGDGTTSDRSTPTSVTGLSSPAVAVAAGAEHTCVATADGSIACWGRNSFGQLGDGTTTGRAVPVAVSGLIGPVTALTAGKAHTCALSTHGAVFCWGQNSWAQLGIGDTTDRLVPTAVPSLSSGVAAVIAGGDHTCVLDTQGGAQCWGANAFGQVGDGSPAISVPRPTAVAGLFSGTVALGAGGGHTCAELGGGGMKCWGLNASGELGDATTSDRRTPVELVRSMPTTAAPMIVLHPADVAGVVGSTVEFLEGCRGTPAPRVQWQVSTDAGTTWRDINGATSWSYLVTVALADNGRQFRAVLTNDAGTATTNAAGLLVRIPPTVSAEPANRTAPAGGTVSFMAGATGTPAPTVQWQASTDAGVTWSDIGGATDETYSFTASSADNGARFRAVFTNTAGTAVSQAAVLTVSKTMPVITWAAPAAIAWGTSLGGGQLNATANDQGTFAYAPPAGTVLASGVGQTLTAIFTPTDAGHYTTATKAVTIDVSSPQLLNGGFEAGSETAPSSWTTSAWQETAAFGWDAIVRHTGMRSGKVSALTANDAGWYQAVTLEPDTNYLLSGWIKTQSVANSAESTNAGANLCLQGASVRTRPLVGTNDWTYVRLVFNSGATGQVTIGARIGFYSGTTTGTAWFDDIRVTAIRATDPHPRWNVLALIYKSTDVTITQSGVPRHVVGTVPQSRLDAAAAAVQRFVDADIPTLNEGNMIPRLTIRYPQALSRVTARGSGWWPDPADTLNDRSPQEFDSVIVVWEPNVVDQVSGQSLWIGAGPTLTLPNGTQQPYATLQFDAVVGAGARNTLKKEWGHSILFYADAAGGAPKPAVDANAAASAYVNCHTGQPYVWVEETEASPVPNSIFNNDSGFTHDYYSGRTALATNPTVCLGIPASTWALGGPVSGAGDNPPSMTTHPANLLGVAGWAAVLTAAVSGDPAPSLQWQVSTDGGGTWTNLTEGAPYAGVQADTLTITIPTIAWTGRQYRILASNSVGSVTSQAATLTVAASSPQVIWSTPAPITYGTPLSAAQLTATASVPGSFLYTPTAGAVLSAGFGRPLQVTFSPADSASYTTVTRTVFIDVTPAPPIITWSKPSAIGYGTPLSAAQLAAVANVPGRFVYAPALGTVVQAGAARPLSVTFTPTDTANYEAVTKTVTIDVSRGTPIVTWPNPAPVAYGTALSARQLNATASVPGTFSYTPTLGAVVLSGTARTLSVTFTPTDRDRYNLVTKAVTIDVTASAGLLTLSQGATPVANGGTFGYGTKAIGAYADAVFTIGNAGSADVVLSALPLTLSGTDANQFSVVSQPASSVAAGESTTFTIRFRPTTAGAKTAQVSIANSGTSGSAFMLNLSGTGAPAFTFEPFNPDNGGGGPEGRLISRDASGVLDAVVTGFMWPPAASSVYHLSNDGAGHFTDTTASVLGAVTTVHARHFAIADFTGDGRPDLLIADHGADVSPFPGGQSRLLVRTASGLLADETATRLPQVQAFTHHVSAGDIDGDGDVDLYMCNIWNQGNVGPRFYFNDGSGHFVADTTRIPLNIANLTAKYTASALVDVDGDGDLDLVLGGHPGAGQSTSNDVILLNDGNGRFTSSSSWTLPARTGNGNWGTVAITVADFDGDGWPDLLMNVTDENYTTGSLQLLLHTNGGYIDASANIPQNWTSSEAFWLKWALPADFNNDGWMDFVITGNGIGPRLFLNTGGGVFVDRTDLVPSLSRTTSSMLPGDLDGDGDIDILALWPGGTTYGVIRNEAPVQTATACGYTLTPDWLFAPSAGGDVGTTLQTGAACGWTAGTSATWLHITSAASGSGPASIVLRADANTGYARTGIVTVAGRRLVVWQGTDSTILAALHPADSNRDFKLVISEVTAYGSAWKRGTTWATPPNPIPIGYVTRAGQLWRLGETYRRDVGDCPLCWLPLPPTARPEHEADPSPTGGPAAERVDKPTAPRPAGVRTMTGVAVRQPPATYVPTVPLTVILTVTPDGDVQTWALEEKVPAGWRVSAVSTDGYWDEKAGVVRWGPFFDETPQTLRYTLTPPAVASGPQDLRGTASFDGADVAVTGVRTLQRAPITRPGEPGGLLATGLNRGRTQ